MELILNYGVPTLVLFSIFLILWQLSKRIDELEKVILPATKQHFEFRAELQQSRIDVLTQEIETIKKRISSHH